ncbi:aquaporin [Massilia sp. R2A-15]|uniref:aquaporin n=1 Tax=Massilia sp. R2A-15 TaxID=3064278 RepID=UPI002732A4FC|nr:aquaporin [Massilia sp. R2A-15]WLI91159.1 aquaporin [Massilia sp. R2A-15]
MTEASGYVAQFRQHWPQYAIEAAGLGAFMLVAALVDTALESHRFPLHVLVASALLRRALMGVAMGGTAVALIYSPWGARSGAHFNPALTLTYALLGKIGRFDAAMYACAQFAGGAAGVLLAHLLAGPALAEAPVSFAVTVPGSCGVGVAFGMEMLISAMLMGASLYASNQVRLMRYTGLICGVLIALFVTFEAPFSGMSMNPARSVGSALPSGIWTAMWLYFTAPIMGMGLGALVYRATGPAVVACAKLNHDTDAPCPFRCHFTARGIHVPSLIRGAESELAKLDKRIRGR